jgi:hypothetical protein
MIADVKEDPIEEAMELIVTASLGKPRRSHHETAVGDGHFPSTNASAARGISTKANP